MLDADHSSHQGRRRDGYLALADMGLTGDGTIPALVAGTGSSRAIPRVAATELSTLIPQ